MDEEKGRKGVEETSLIHPSVVGLWEMTAFHCAGKKVVIPARVTALCTLCGRARPLFPGETLGSTAILKNNMLC